MAGRKRIYKSSAERQKAYRQRKEQNQSVKPDSIQQIRRKKFKEKYSHLLFEGNESILSKSQLTLVIDWLSGKSYSTLAKEYVVSPPAIRQRLKVIEETLEGFKK
jgi:predicted RNA polymerase sigma factor